MKNKTSSALKLSLLIISLIGFSGCGQKGPLVIEQPPEKIQIEEPAETK